MKSLIHWLMAFWAPMMVDAAGGGGGDGEGDAGQGGEGDGGAPAGLMDAASDDPKAISDQPTDGNRPDWAPEKFWNAEKGELNGEAMAEAYKGLETRLRNGDGKAPETADAYELKLPEGVDPGLIPDDDPMVGWFKGKAHELGMSQEAAQSLYQDYLTESIKALGDMPAPGEPQEMSEEEQKQWLSDEMAKLGPRGQAIVDHLAAKANQFQEYGLFSEADMQEWNIACGTAEGAAMMNKLLDYYGEKSIPTDGHTAAGLPSAQELEAMRFETIPEGQPHAGQQRYAVDSAYAAKIDRLYEQVYGTEASGSSIVMGGN